MELFKKKGPWIDNITLDFEPGDVSIQGNLIYSDRLSVTRGANGVKVELWDSDNVGNDLLAVAYADSNGHYSFPSQMNWDIDDTDPNLMNRMLDLYVVWTLENNYYKVTNTYGYPYYWTSPTINNINMGDKTISGSLTNGISNLESMWIFQDIRRTREYYLGNTNPQVDPGFLIAHWEEGLNVEGLIQGSHFWAPEDPHVFIAHDSRRSADTIVHELGHYIMWNQTGQWLWYDFNCFNHNIFSQESAICAWSEGWANFFALAVNRDVCYDFDEGPCTGLADGRHYNLENHTRNDNDFENFPWGDEVEGRVAGALYDLLDVYNESPWYDTALWGFDQIVDIAFKDSGQYTLYEFWSSYTGNNKHHGIRSIYQNTIDYNQSPEIEAIPDQYTFINMSQNHLIDLWDYTSDFESPNTALTYQIQTVSDLGCGISLDSHWININPLMNWSGSCLVTIRVNDTIKTTTGEFWLHVLPVNSRIYLPIIIND